MDPYAQKLTLLFSGDTDYGQQTVDTLFNCSELMTSTFSITDLKCKWTTRKNLQMNLAGSQTIAKAIWEGTESLAIFTPPLVKDLATAKIRAVDSTGSNSCGGAVGGNLTIEYETPVSPSISVAAASGRTEISICDPMTVTLTVSALFWDPDRAGSISWSADLSGVTGLTSVVTADINTELTKAKDKSTFTLSRATRADLSGNFVFTATFTEIAMFTSKAPNGRTATSTITMTALASGSKPAVNIVGPSTFNFDSSTTSLLSLTAAVTSTICDSSSSATPTYSWTCTKAAGGTSSCFDSAS
eukprot:350872_1